MQMKRKNPIVQEHGPEVAPMDRVVDVHSRVGVGRGFETRRPDQALSEMRRFGVAVSWICPPDACAAVRNHEGNDYVAGVVADNRDAFVGCAVANPWYGDEAVEELGRAFEMGLRVLYLHPSIQGFQISDEIVDPVVVAAQQRGMPIYVPTGTPVCAMPYQLSALARKHRDARFIMGHMGYADFWYDAVGAARGTENIWLETSFMDVDIIRDAVKSLGPERVVFGTAAPLADVGVEIEKLGMLGLPQADFDKIMYLNARGLMPCE